MAEESSSTGQANEPTKPQLGSKNTQQIAVAYAKVFRAYITDLKAHGHPLPSRNGKVDKTAIAKACNFPRLTLYKNMEVASLLEEAMVDIDIGICSGAEIADSDSSQVQLSKAEYFEQVADKGEQIIHKLREELLIRKVELAEVRREKKELTEKLRQYEVMEEIMATTGRRFRP